MARRKKVQAHTNHERWLISYADFITLLFAFFVVMFASSQADKGRAQQMSDAVKKALEGQSLSQRFAAILGGTPDNENKRNAMMRGPGGAQKAPVEKQDLKTEIASGADEVRMEARGLVVSFKQAAVFPSGEDVISPSSYGTLGKLAVVIARLPNPVRLEGHTDSIPISTARFHSNWELSAARSIAIMDLLTTRFGLARERLSIAGYADVAPIASNDTEAGRARNRRVDVVILSEQGVISEPNNQQPAPDKPLN